MGQQGFSKSIPEQVIRLAQKGDQKSFEHIYLTYVDASFNLAYRICNDAQLAEDIVQNSFIKVFRAIKKFRFNGAFAGWIRRIVSNETISRIRERTRLQLVDCELVAEPESQNLFESQWILAVKDLDHLLNQLSTTARAVVLLHEVEGYNHQEIANMFDKSESFSKVTLSRALSKLKSISKVDQNKGENYALK